VLGLVVVVLGAGVHGGQVTGQERAVAGRTLLGDDVAVDATEEEVFGFAVEAPRRVPGSEGGLFFSFKRARARPAGVGGCRRDLIGCADSCRTTDGLGVLFKVVDDVIGNTGFFELPARFVAAVIVLYDRHLDVGSFRGDLASAHQ